MLSTLPACYLRVFCVLSGVACVLAACCLRLLSACIVCVYCLRVVSACCLRVVSACLLIHYIGGEWRSIAAPTMMNGAPLTCNYTTVNPLLLSFPFPFPFLFLSFPFLFYISSLLHSFLLFYSYLFVCFQNCSLHLHGITSWYTGVAPPLYSAPTAIGLLLAVGKSFSLLYHFSISSFSSYILLLMFIIKNRKHWHISVVQHVKSLNFLDERWRVNLESALEPVIPPSPSLSSHLRSHAGSPSLALPLHSFLLLIYNRSTVYDVGDHGGLIVFTPFGANTTVI